MKKTIALLAAFMLATSAIIAETEVDATTTTTEESSGTKLKNAFSDFVNDVSSTATSSVKKKQISVKLKNYVGSWKFSNGNDTTVFTINSDITMTVTQSDGETTTTWTGSCTAATSNEFTFTATKKETVKGSEKSAEKVTAAWALKYKKVETDELRIVSDDLPNDTNDYDFSNPTLFTRKTE